MSQTPILDREQPLPAVKRKLKVWPALLLGVAIGSLLAARDAYSGRLLVSSPSPAVLILFIATFYLGVLVHELGHVAAGFSAGFELRALGVGPWLLTKSTRGWKMRFLPRRILFGGVTATVPRSADRLVQRYLRVVLGGPIASVLLLAAALILTSLFPENVAIRALLYVSLFLTAMCCLPYTIRSQPTDAKSILLLIQKGPAAERFAAILYILALDAQQIEPHAWPPELVEQLAIPTQDKTRLAASIYFRYAVALDGGDSERIAEAIERGLSVNHEAGPDMQRAFQIAASQYQSIFRHNAPLAQTWLDAARTVRQTTSRKDWDAKAQASIALVNGEYTRGRELLTRYLSMLDQIPPSGMIAAERTRTMDLLSRTVAPPGEGLRYDAWTGDLKYP